MTTPWLDEGARPDAFQPLTVHPPANHRWLSLGIVGGLYAGFSTWAYFAWYRDKAKLGDFEWSEDGFFGRNTYAGGSDKLGHAWATMVLSRAGADVLRTGGWDRTSAAVTSSALAWALFLLVEIKDGYYYRFSRGDFYFNTGGAVLGGLAERFEPLDRLIDFKVAYYPSDEYIGLWHGRYYGTEAGNSLNIAEDYSGETYFLALHLGALPLPASTPKPLATALQYLDVGAAFETRKYKPDAPPGSVATQKLYLGATLNLQKVFDRLLDRRSPRGRKIAHWVFEFYAPPFSIVPVVGAKRTADGTPPDQ